MSVAEIKALAEKTVKYDPSTGEFTWLSRPGSRAGSVNGSGYVLLRIGGKVYRAHRIAWLMMHGCLPSGDIDHINGNRSDNRIDNLRVVTRSENMRNARRPSNNTSGRIGVYWHKRERKWGAGIKVNGRFRHIGRFNSFDEACAARQAAERENGFHENHGRI